MKGVWILGIALACSLLTAGCMSERYLYRHRKVRPDSLAMTMQDVISLSQAKVSDDVIISQIHASDAHFMLSSQDLINLTQAGVSDSVINAMIKTGEPGSGYRRAGAYAGYSYGPSYYPNYWYWDYPFVYPWFFGLSVGYYRPFFTHYGYAPRIGFSNHYGGFRGRTFGSHR